MIKHDDLIEEIRFIRRSVRQDFFDHPNDLVDSAKFSNSTIDFWLVVRFSCSWAPYSRQNFENSSQQARSWATCLHKVSRNILLLFSQHGAVSKLFPMSKVLLTYQMVKIQFLFLTRMQQKMIQYPKRYFGLFKILKFILQELTIWWILWNNIIISFVRHMPHREVSRRKLMMDVYQCSPPRPPGMPKGQRSMTLLLDWIPRNFKNLIFSPNRHFWA